MGTPALRLAVAVVVTLPLLACSAIEAPKQLRGNRVDADLLKELTPGTSSRRDVASLLGSPTARATFDDNTWIYIGEVTRTRVGRVPGIDSQEVVVMSFDQEGTLRSVKRLNQDDSRDVQVVSRTTPSPGSEASFLQQLLGNVGRFSPGGGLGAASRQSEGSSGATSGSGRSE